MTLVVVMTVLSFALLAYLAWWSRAHAALRDLDRAIDRVGER